MDCLALPPSLPPLSSPRVSPSSHWPPLSLILPSPPLIRARSCSARFLAADLTEAQLDALLTAFIGDVADGTYAQKGWPKSAYGVSKAGMTAYTVLSARTYAERADAKKGVLINACCPGYVNTLLSSNKGPLTPDQGAVTPVKLALLPAGDTTTGKFWSKEQVHPLA